MSDNLKDDIRNAIPSQNKGFEVEEPEFKEPQFLMHCLTNNNISLNDINKDNNENNQDKQSN